MRTTPYYVGRSTRGSSPCCLVSKVTCILTLQLLLPSLLMTGTDALGIFGDRSAALRLQSAKLSDLKGGSDEDNDVVDPDVTSDKADDNVVASESLWNATDDLHQNSDLEEQVTTSANQTSFFNKIFSIFQATKSNGSGDIDESTSDNGNNNNMALVGGATAVEKQAVDKGGGEDGKRSSKDESESNTHNLDPDVANPSSDSITSSETPSLKVKSDAKSSDKATSTKELSVSSSDEAGAGDQSITSNGRNEKSGDANEGMKADIDIQARQSKTNASHSIDEVKRQSQVESSSVTPASSLQNQTAEEVSNTSTQLVERSESRMTTTAAKTPWESSGAWKTIDALASLGLAGSFPSLRLSRQLRYVRKAAAKTTGLHGILSGKPSSDIITDSPSSETNATIESIRLRIAAIDRAREGVERALADEYRRSGRRGLFRRRQRVRSPPLPQQPASESIDPQTSSQEEERKLADELLIEQQRLNELKVQLEAERKKREQYAKEEKERMDRVRDIDRLISEGQGKLQKLVCEKDVLQRRPNPLWNYTTSVPIGKKAAGKASAEPPKSSIEESGHASRKFNFPPDDLVEEYLDMTFSTRRLSRMNHTHLWKNTESSEEDDDETIGDDLLTPSADAHKLYTANLDKTETEDRKRHKNGGSGSWLLRQSLAGGPSLGEKIGETAETAAYKAVCAAVMSFLARTLSSLHGVNVMKHSDIRLYLEQAPDLPPIGQGLIPDSANYAEETLKTVMKRKMKKQRRRSKDRQGEEAFVQHDAVTEMLLSHCQISAPLLKLFPLAWQRALFGNIITLATTIMSDFFDGLQFQILGHNLSFSFKPITEADMISHLGFAGRGFNTRKAKPEQFEAAVQATAADVSNELKFLDRWHERALGSGVLRTQIANLIARIVLTLTDEILSGAKMDLWSTQAGGPRMIAGLEYRIKTDSEYENDDDDDADLSDLD